MKQFVECLIVPIFHCPKSVVRVFMSIIIAEMYVLPKTSSGSETDILVGPNYFRGSKKLLGD